jgi:hypothetical protein
LYVKGKNINSKLKFHDQKQNIGFCVWQGSENIKSWHSENVSAIVIGTWNSAVRSHFCAEVGRCSHFAARLLFLEEIILIGICDGGAMTLTTV